MQNSKKSVFKEGAYIYVEGDEDVENVFILESGIVELLSSNKKVKRYKSIIRGGEVFGFISSLCRRPRMESAIARRETVIVTMKRNHFIYLIQKNPEIAVKLLRYFAEELRLYDEMLFSLTEHESDMVPNELELFNMGEYYQKRNSYPYAHYILSRYTQLYPGGMKINIARQLLESIMKAGFKGNREPVKDGIYKVFHDKEMIFCENEPGEELYIIKEGKVKIVKINNNNEIMLSVLRDGDIFGELAIVSEKPRNASAISWGKTVLLPIRKENLVWVLGKSPAIINKIFMAISQRIWFTFIMLESKLYTKPMTRIYSFIENKLMEADISLRSKTPVSLNYSIDELYHACNIPESRRNAVVDLLTDDTNIEFNFGQLVIKNPSILASKANTYKSRDHIKSEMDDTAVQKNTGGHNGDDELTGSELDTFEAQDDIPDFSAEEEPAVQTDFQPSEDADSGGVKLPSDDIPFDMD